VNIGVRFMCEHKHCLPLTDFLFFQWFVFIAEYNFKAHIYLVDLVQGTEVSPGPEGTRF
jgi:hypothetical protein